MVRSPLSLVEPVEGDEAPRPADNRGGVPPIGRDPDPFPDVLLQRRELPLCLPAALSERADDKLAEEGKSALHVVMALEMGEYEAKLIVVHACARSSAGQCVACREQLLRCEHLRSLISSPGVRTSKSDLGSATQGRSRVVISCNSANAAASTRPLLRAASIAPRGSTAFPSGSFQAAPVEPS